MDASVNPDPDEGDESDEMSSDTELCVPVDSLAIDGTRPAVGDQVDVKVSGPITRLVNDNAYVKVEKVNDQPLPAPSVTPNPNVSETDRLQKLSRMAGAME